METNISGPKIHHMPELNYYRLVETGGKDGINGGIVKSEREGPWPGNMLFYIAYYRYRGCHSPPVQVVHCVGPRWTSTRGRPSVRSAYAGPFGPR